MLQQFQRQFSQQNQRSSLPPVFKGIIAVGTLVGVAFILYKLTHGAIRNLRNSRGGRSEVENSKTALDEAIKSGKPPTISQTLSDTIANKLFVAFDGYGTDYRAVKDSIFQLKNDADVLSVIKSFGIREISSGRFSPEPNLKGSLSEAMTSELSESQAKEINDYLAKQGIKYKF